MIAETVATPLEEQINGVENMLYMSSQATADGVMTLTVTFKLGTDVDLAQVQVQNRVSQALPRLPEEVRQLGVTTVKSSPNLTMVVHLVSPDDRYDMTSTCATTRCCRSRTCWRASTGVGQVQIFGAGDYAMRVWLDPAEGRRARPDRRRRGRRHPRAERAGRGRRGGRRRPMPDGASTTSSPSTPAAG